jgi:TonB family protein
MSRKIFLILIAVMTYVLSAKAQRIDTLVYYMKTLRVADWPSHAEVPGNDKDSSDFYRVILPPDTNSDKNLFVVNDFYKSGRAKMIGQTKSRKYYLELNGVCVEFFPNGRRKSAKNYNKGKLKGDIVEYYPNGKMYLTGVYDDSSKLVVTECRDSTGKVLAQNGDGHYVKYDEAFKHVDSEGDIVKGRESGEWQGTLGDTIKYTCTYENGVAKNGISHNLNGKEYIFSKAEDEPTYKGGMQNFYRFLAREIHYPAVAKENNVQGKIFLTFVVNKDGSLSEIRVIRGIGSGCDEESLRVLKLSPKWIPGKLYGVPVRVQYTVPITFTLSYENH